MVKSSNSSLFRVNSAESQAPLKQQFFPEIGAENSNLMRIDKSLTVILRQLKLVGRRERTLHEYYKWTHSYMNSTGHQFLQEITVESIYIWLESMGSISNSTKLIKLKSLKAVLSKCYDSGWLKSKFWNSIKITVDQKTKPAATEKEVITLVSVMDLTDFFELRDATAVLLMYRTGIRLATLSKLTERHVDFSEGFLNLSGDIREKKLYLNPFLDMYNSEIISYHISEKPNALVIMEALEEAIQVTEDCIYRRIFHSDQGWAYQMNAYNHKLKEHKIFQSMSRKGTSLDNSIMENFFSLLKQKIYYGREYRSFEELKQAIDAPIFTTITMSV